MSEGARARARVYFDQPADELAIIRDRGEGREGGGYLFAATR